MTDIDEILARVERLDREATAGRWQPGTYESEDGAERSACGPEHVLTSEDEDEDEDEDEVYEREVLLVEADAELIAAYRSDAPALAAEVRRLRLLLAERAAAEARAKRLADLLAEARVCVDMHADATEEPLFAASGRDLLARMDAALKETT